MTPWILGLLTVAFVGFGACTKRTEEPDSDAKATLDKIQHLESELTSFRERIKSVDSDRGLRDQLVEDEALLKSRLERLKERSKILNPAEGDAPR